jgi:hypothetical protein
MRRTRLLMIAIASFLGTVLGEGLTKRAIALLVCGVFSFNSTACYASFGNRGEQAIGQIPRVRQQNPQSGEVPKYKPNNNSPQVVPQTLIQDSLTSPKNQSLESNSSCSDHVFEVQTRQSPVNRSLSLNSAVAMRVGNDRVAFYSKDFPDSDTSTPLRVNGKPTVVKDKSLTLPGGGSVQKQSDSNYVVQWAIGEKVAVTIYSRGQFQYMDVFPFVFESQANQMVGLLGNVNGKENDDLRFRSGDILPSKSTYGGLSKLIKDISPIRLPLGQLEKVYFDQLNKDFGNSWRVSAEESLFDYPSEKSTKTFTDKAFPDAYLTLDMLSPAQLQAARSQCVNAGVQVGLLEGCVFDVAFTGYSEFAARTA